MCCLVECSIAAILAIICTDAKFSIISCDIERIGDFYTLFFDTMGVQCSSDRAYPLYTLVFLYYLFCVILMFLFRVPVSKLVSLMERKKDADFEHAEAMEQFFYSVYVPLWIIPVLALLHYLFIGLIYYAYAYIGLVMCFGADLVHSALMVSGNDRDPLIKRSFWIVFRYLVSVWLIYAILDFFYHSKVNLLWLLMCFGAPSMY